LTPQAWWGFKQAKLARPRLCVRRIEDDDQTMTAEAAAIRPGAPARRPLFRRRSAIPGFTLTLGVTLTVLSLIVLIPLSAVAKRYASGELAPKLGVTRQAAE